MCVFGFSQSVLGSIMPFRRDESDFSTVQVGWHFSLYAIGVLSAGLVSGRLLRRTGSSKAIAGGLVALVISMLLSTFVTFYAGSLVVAVTIGLAGVTVQVAAQAEIVNHHANEDVAITEAFVFAGLGVVGGPLIIGGAETLLTWRWAMGLPLLAAIPLAMWFMGQPLRSGVDRVVPGPRTKLPPAILLCWAMIVLAIATEWGVGFWGAQFLESRYDVTAERGVTFMAVFFGGTVVGRIITSRLLIRFGRREVLYAALWLGGLSVLGLWGFRWLPVGLVMLALAGMSLGNFFPLILSVAISHAGDEVERISSGSAQAIGLALLTVPISLAYLADQIGLVDAVGLLAVLPLVMLGLFFSGESGRIGGQRRAATSSQV